MRCDVVRQLVEEDIERSSAVQAHLESCANCKEYLRRWETVRGGLVALRQEEPPEPSIGFSARVIRRLGNAAAESQIGQQFFDQIGRRVVYATLTLALVLLLVLVLPSSGPYRSSGVTESILAHPQFVTVSSEQIFGVGGADSGGAADVYYAAPVNAGQGGQGPR